MDYTFCFIFWIMCLFFISNTHNSALGKMSGKTNKCLNCGREISKNGAKRCHSCATKFCIKEKRGSIFKEGNKFGFKKGVLNYPKCCFQKGNVVNLGRYLTKEIKEKISKALCKHHIWYEDNMGNLTDKGIMLVTRAHHMEIHAVLRHNLWTDNRRYLAG